MAVTHDRNAGVAFGALAFLLISVVCFFPSLSSGQLEPELAPNVTCSIADQSCQICVQSGPVPFVGEINSCTSFKFDACLQELDVNSLLNGAVLDGFPQSYTADDLEAEGGVSVFLPFTISVVQCQLFLSLQDVEIGSQYLKANVSFNATCDLGALGGTIQVNNTDGGEITLGSESQCEEIDSCDECLQNPTCGWCFSRSLCTERPEFSALTNCLACEAQSFSVDTCEPPQPTSSTMDSDGISPALVVPLNFFIFFGSVAIAFFMM